MFPELQSRLKGLLSRSNSGPISLNLKQDVASFGISTSDLWYRNNGYNKLFQLITGGAPGWAGESVNRDTALRHPVFWACNRLISETIGFLPAVLMQRKGSEKIIAADHPMYGAMKNAPNDEITAQCFSEMQTSHCLLQGNAYALIVRRSGVGTAIELHGLNPDCVNPDREKTGQRRLVYVIKVDREADKTYTVEAGKPHDIFHIRGLGWDGLRGWSVIDMARNSVGSAIAAERNVARFWAGGGRVPYILEMAQKFKTDAEFDKFRVDWEQTYSQPHKVPVLENGITYKQTGLDMVDSQALETRQAQIAEICRWFSVSPHLVGDLSHATFSNIEHLTLEFVKMTLTSWLTRWEQSFWQDVLTAEEKKAGYFLHHNLNALLRGDFQTRMAGYATALQNGLWNVDEVRDKEDLNALPDGAGQAYHFQMNLQTTPGTGKPTVVEQGILDRAAASKAPAAPASSAPAKELTLNLTGDIVRELKVDMPKQDQPRMPDIVVNVTVPPGPQVTKSQTVRRGEDGLIKSIDTELIPAGSNNGK